MNVIKAAILGTQQTGDDARDVLRQAGIVGFQRLAGYVINHMNETPSTSLCWLFPHLSEPIALQIKDTEYPQLDSIYAYEYSHIIVFDDFVVMHYEDAVYWRFDWRHIEITRDALIEMWSCEPCQPRNDQSLK